MTWTGAQLPDCVDAHRCSPRTIRPESIKDMQRNWIGRSVGAQFGFEVAQGPLAGERIEVYTTRPDTLFGATYVVIAPEHPLALRLSSPEQQAAVEAYTAAASRKSDLERTELAKEKTGVWTGASVLNPATGALIPVWVAGMVHIAGLPCAASLSTTPADYVLGGYGCGAIMAVPAHDQRDAEFAATFGLKVKAVVIPFDGAAPSLAPFCSDGVLANSSNASVGLDLNGALGLQPEVSFPRL